MKTVLVTGSAGLIGSESVKFFIAKGFFVVGIDNNMREYFFGSEASTEGKRKELEKTYAHYKHYVTDIRDYRKLKKIFSTHHFDLIIHTAAQPSHDWAAKEPLTDFGINAVGTLNLLELTRLHCPEAVFIFTSTNKVYGDRPNSLPFIELATRFELPKDHPLFDGIDESMSIDNTLHSVFGASKVAADVMVQEYGKYFGMKTGVFRGGCLTGPAHAGTQLHGFLAYLVRCVVAGRAYTIFGYGGKQVRDNIHSYDLVQAFYHYYRKPRIGEVYNMGGSRHSNISMKEAILRVEKLTGKKAQVTYVNQSRKGDHIWYISDISKFKRHYPAWKYRYSMEDTLKEIIDAAKL